MKTAYFIRFTETIEEDIKRNTSILTNHDNLIVEGLCAFFGEDTIEKTHERAQNFGKLTANAGDTYVIVEANEVWNSKTGTLGTVIENCKIISTGIVK